MVAKLLVVVEIIYSEFIDGNHNLCKVISTH